MLSILMITMKKKIIILISLLLLGGAVWKGDLLEYAASMGWGQMKILFNTKSVKKYINDENVPDSLKQNVLLIQEIKKFTVDSLGFEPSRNYSSVFDQKGKPLMWVVTACKKYSLEAKVWSFPIVGDVTYKGFFKEEKAKQEAAVLEAEGYETKIRVVNAWSTLGWFKDPIMTSMLEESPGSIANVIIHELSHGTVFVKNNVEYSENLANFIGDQGAYLFLKTKYGPNSEEYISFLYDNEDYNLLASHFVQQSKSLDSLYQSESFKSLPDTEKDILKEAKIKAIVEALDTIPFHAEHRRGKILKNELPNNAFFTVFLQYNNQQDEFEEEFMKVANGDLRTYVAYLRKKFP